MSEEMRFDILTQLTIFRSGAAGATHLIATYSGSGDSGGLDAVRAVRMPPDFNLDDGFEAEDQFDGVPEVPIPAELKRHLEEWVWEYIPSHGWENNEGGGGALVLDLATLKMRVEHYDNGEDQAGERRVNRLRVTDRAAREELKALSDKELETASRWLYVYTDDEGYIDSVECTSYEAGKSQPLIPKTVEWLRDAMPDSFFPYERFTVEANIERKGKGFEVVIECRETVNGRSYESHEHEVEIA